VTAQAGPVFVVGSKRSGSTLLRLVLDSHPNIAIGPETGFMRAVAATKEIPYFRAGRGWYERLGWDEKELDERLREFYDGIFRRSAARQGKARWGEKTPFHISHLRDMATIFPDSSFVGIVRHPGAVARSLQGSFHYTFDEAVAYWTATNAELLRSGVPLGDRFLLCRYEDVVSAPEPVLREVLGFLGEPWSPALLAHHEVQRDRGAPRVTDGSTVTRDAIDPTRASRWAQTLDEAELAALRRTHALARFLGYDEVDPVGGTGRLVGAAAPGRTATGGALAAAWSRLEPLVDVAHAPSYTDASTEELARRLERSEAALQRVRSRRAVRVADAVRKVQRGRSLSDVRAAWALLRADRTGR
jgi:hypothetical protein